LAVLKVQSGFPFVPAPVRPPRWQIKLSLPPADQCCTRPGNISGDGIPRRAVIIPLAKLEGPRDPVKVNNASANEMKLACDDAVKRFLSQPGAFKTINWHTDVRITLGWSSVLVSALTALYGWKVEFEKSKPVVWAGVILYLVLTSIQSLYAYFIEKDIVFEGKRKTLARRIETELITLSSRTIPSSRSAPSPKYKLSISYVHSTNSGKLLLGRGKDEDEESYNQFFDGDGVMDQEKFEEWVGARVSRVMISDDKSK